MITVRSGLRALFLIALAACVSQGTALAQGPTGRIEVIVHDDQGGALPGVTMTLKNQGTGVTRTITTEPDGRYSFPALAPGRYSLRAKLSGFAVQEAHDIVITIGFEHRLDLSMKVQSLQETVTVSGESPVVDTTKAEVAGVVTREQIEMLPINSRQYLSLALLVPGTTRNSGNRNLNLDAVNAYRAANGLAAISESQIESSRINIVDVRVSKRLRLARIAASS